MKFGLPEASITLLAVGIVVTVFATLEYTGVWSNPVPGVLIYLGYAMIIAGIVIFEIAVRQGKRSIEDYEKDVRFCALLSAVPDDGDYVVDLTGEVTEAPDTTLEDLTAVNVPDSGKEEKGEASA